MCPSRLFLNDNKLTGLPPAVLQLLPRLVNFRVEPNLFELPDDVRKGGIKAVCSHLKKISAHSN